MSVPHTSSLPALRPDDPEPRTSFTPKTVTYQSGRFGSKGSFVVFSPRNPPGRTSGSGTPPIEPPLIVPPEPPVIPPVQPPEPSPILMYIWVRVHTGALEPWERVPAGWAETRNYVPAKWAGAPTYPEESLPG